MHRKERRQRKKERAGPGFGSDGKLRGEAGPGYDERLRQRVGFFPHVCKSTLSTRTAAMDCA